MWVCITWSPLGPRSGVRRHWLGSRTGAICRCTDVAHIVVRAWACVCACRWKSTPGCPASTVPTFSTVVPNASMPNWCQTTNPSGATARPKKIALLEVKIGTSSEESRQKIHAGGENALTQGCCTTKTGQRRRFRMVRGCGDCCVLGESVSALNRGYWVGPLKFITVRSSRKKPSNSVASTKIDLFGTRRWRLCWSTSLIGPCIYGLHLLEKEVSYSTWIVETGPGTYVYC
jgi:hypothetical protein